MFYGLESKDPRGATKILGGGLTGNAIKVIGIILMAFDHLHQMFWAQGAPDWLNWLGRPVLPIFLFMCAEGFYHTHSRRKYLLRLFIGFEFMNIANTALSLTMPNENVMLINNVFGTMLLTLVYLTFTGTLHEGLREKHAGKIVAGALLMLLPVVYSLVFVVISDVMPRQAIFALLIIPNILFTEGGVSAVILGILFYLFREKRLMQTLALFAFSALSFMADSESNGAQWMMVFALVPILLYNGKRGNGSKYFFYVFYPAHLYLFYTVAWAIK
jgi:hypothetical protein